MRTSKDFRNSHLKVGILKEEKNVACKELDNMTDIQWLELGSTRTENVSRVVRDIKGKMLGN